jgi:hypothetical protein
LGEPLRALMRTIGALVRSRRAIRSITFAPHASFHSHFVASVVPLLSLSLFAPLVRAGFARAIKKLKIKRQQECHFEILKNLCYLCAYITKSTKIRLKSLKICVICVPTS